MHLPAFQTMPAAPEDKRPALVNLGFSRRVRNELAFPGEKNLPRSRTGLT